MNFVTNLITVAVRHIDFFKYSYYDDKLVIDYCISTYRHFYEIYFDSLQHAQQVMEEFRDELIWYFTEFKERMD